jgi:SAM-dependent methyltransferase
MLSLTSQQKAEVDFWKQCFVHEEKSNVENYLKRRQLDYLHYCEMFSDYWATQDGYGLEVGTGLFSVLGFKGDPIIALDPLNLEYEKIYKDDTRPWITYKTGSGENIPYSDQSFDYAWCCNVIDHTPNPQRIAIEIRRVLKPKGKLYFTVNFDPELYAPHYHLWTQQTVDGALYNFKLLVGTVRWFPAHKKYVYIGVYEKP